MFQLSKNIQTEFLGQMFLELFKSGKVFLGQPCKYLGEQQSQKTQGFCVADFATLSDERRSRSKIFPLFIWIKEPCVRKFEGLKRSKLLGFRKLNKDAQ